MGFLLGNILGIVFLWDIAVGDHPALFLMLFQFRFQHITMDRTIIPPQRTAKTAQNSQGTEKE